MQNITELLSQNGISVKLQAIIQIVAILIGAALLGYAIARSVARNRLASIREEIELKRIELAECRAIIIDEPVLEKPVVKNVISSAPPIPHPVPSTYDDLKIIEGIGPKIEEILNKNDIRTYAGLAETSPIRIAAILRTAGPRYQIHDPSSWPKQASLARQGRWQSLEDFKNKLISGSDNW